MQVIPGQRISNLQQHQYGNNTYVYNGDIYSSVIGRVEIADNCVSVHNSYSVLKPSNGDQALAKVVYVTYHQVYLDVFAIGSKACRLPGIIREQDHKNEPFEVGDIVRCCVLQLQDNNVVLTTRHPNTGIMDKKLLADLFAGTATSGE